MKTQEGTEKLLIKKLSKNAGVLCKPNGRRRYLKRPAGSMHS